jgi:NADP-dependent 3-hydroxy acid dehydrogenase YdfG
VIKEKRIIITGCGYNPLKERFTNVIDNSSTHNSLFINDVEMKLNIGAATASVLANNDLTVHMVSKSEDKLKNIADSISGDVEYSVVDLLDERQVNSFVQDLPRNKPLYWVQSVGLGAGSYKLKNDNPYLLLENIETELLETEVTTLLRSSHLLIKELLPIFREQNESRIVFISSMSAIRGYSLGGTHCAAKGALDRYANAAMLALYKYNIFVTTIRPGAVDTGMYDDKLTQKAVIDVALEYGCDWSEKISFANPISVGQAVQYVLSTKAHIPSLNLVAQGQFPNEGS